MRDVRQKQCCDLTLSFCSRLAILCSSNMNQHTHELAILKELQRIYTDTSLAIARYKRFQLIASIIGLGLILLSLIGGSMGFLPTREAVLSAFFGGASAGFSFLYRSSLQQLPFLLRFTTLDVQSIQNRIQEIEDFAKSQ